MSQMPAHGRLAHAALLLNLCIALASGLLASTPTKIVGHRGDPYYVPGHTLASYSIAIAEGVDFIEPDVVMTSDGQLVCRHDLDLEQSTDVSLKPEYADRKRSMFLESVGRSFESWWVQDFTLSEIKTLRSVQRVADPALRDPFFNGMWEVATFEESISFVLQRSRALGRPIGIMPELKSPFHYSRASLAAGRNETYFEDEFLRVLGKYGYLDDAPPGPLIVQCAESRTLKYLRSKFPRLQTMQLVFGDAFEPDTGFSHDVYLTRPGMDDLVAYASALGPWKEFLVAGKGPQWWFSNSTGLVPPELVGRLRRNGTVAAPYVDPDDVVRELHKRGIMVFPWTFRNPQEDSSAQIAAALSGGDVAAEFRRFLALGVDGVFVEKALPAVYVRDTQSLCGDSCHAGGDVVIPVDGTSCARGVSTVLAVAIGVASAVAGAGVAILIPMVVRRFRAKRAEYHRTHSNASGTGRSTSRNHIRLAMLSGDGDESDTLFED